MHPFEVESKQLYLQPGDQSGQDCLVAYRETDNNYYADANHVLNPDVAAIRWTYDADGAGEGTNRTYIKFAGLSDIPETATIDSAFISLYGVETGVAAPIGNSFYPGSPFASYGDNSAWLKRVLADWDENSITWNTKPPTTEDDKATVPASTSQWNYDALNINVKEMVIDMVRSKENFGFCLQLKNESIYRGVVFGSSEHPDAAKRPKLVVYYTVRK